VLDVFAQHGEGRLVFSLIHRQLGDLRDELLGRGVLDQRLCDEISFVDRLACGRIEELLFDLRM
jgi:hypothetical protein